MEVNQITKITLCWELFENGVPKSHIGDRLEVNRETVRIWIKGINEFGLQGFTERYLNCKKGEREKRKIDARIKTLIWSIWSIREAERDCCAQKIGKFLFDRQGIKLSPVTIYKILSDGGPEFKAEFGKNA